VAPRAREVARADGARGAGQALSQEGTLIPRNRAGALLVAAQRKLWANAHEGGSAVGLNDTSLPLSFPHRPPGASGRQRAPAALGALTAPGGFVRSFRATRGGGGAADEVASAPIWERVERLNPRHPQPQLLRARLHASAAPDSPARPLSALPADPAPRPSSANACARPASAAPDLARTSSSGPRTGTARGRRGPGLGAESPDGTRRRRRRRRATSAAREYEGAFDPYASLTAAFDRGASKALEALHAARPRRAASPPARPATAAPGGERAPARSRRLRRPASSLTGLSLADAPADRAESPPRALAGAAARRQQQRGARVEAGARARPASALEQRGPRPRAGSRLSIDVASINGSNVEWRSDSSAGDADDTSGGFAPAQGRLRALPRRALLSEETNASAAAVVHAPPLSPSRTDWTRRVPPPVLTGRVSPWCTPPPATSPQCPRPRRLRACGPGPLARR